MEHPNSQGVLYRVSPRYFQIRRSYDMGELLFWIVLGGFPVLLVCGFVYAHYLKRTGDTTSDDDAA